MDIKLNQDTQTITKHTVQFILSYHQTWDDKKYPLHTFSHRATVVAKWCMWFSIFEACFHNLRRTITVVNAINCHNLWKWAPKKLKTPTLHTTCNQFKYLKVKMTVCCTSRFKNHIRQNHLENCKNQKLFNTPHAGF